MNSLNSILLEGNVVRDPEIRTLPSGTQVCTFSVANDRFYKKDDKLEKETSYFDVEAWSRLGLSCAENITKGRGVRIVGRITQDRWTTTDEDGTEKAHAKVKIVAEHVEFKPATFGEAMEAHRRYY